MAHAIQWKCDKLRNATPSLVLPELDLFEYWVARKNHSTEIISHIKNYWMMSVGWPQRTVLDSEILWKNMEKKTCKKNKRDSYKHNPTKVSGGSSYWVLFTLFDYYFLLVLYYGQRMYPLQWLYIARFWNFHCSLVYNQFWQDFYKYWEKCEISVGLLINLFLYSW